MKCDHCFDFENGVVKLQNDEEAKLYSWRKEALKIFLLPTDHGNDSGSDEELSFVEVSFHQDDEQDAKK